MTTLTQETRYFGRIASIPGNDGYAFISIDSVTKVEDGGALVERSGKTLQEIVTAIKKVSDIVAEMAAASREQASGIEQVNKAILQMDQTTQQNAALVEQTAAASQTMRVQAQELQELMGFFTFDQATPTPRTVATEHRRPHFNSRSRPGATAKSTPIKAHSVVKAPLSLKSKAAPISSSEKKTAITPSSPEEWEKF